MLDASGYVTARRQATVSAKVTGKVTELLIEEGQRVEEGAVVSETVVGDRAVVGPHCELRHGMRIWPDVVLPPHGVRFSADV